MGIEGPSGQRPASDTVISRLLGADMFEGTVLETRFVTDFLAWGSATSTPVSTPTAAEELAGIEARLGEVLTRQTILGKRVEALREARPLTNGPGCADCGGQAP